MKALIFIFRKLLCLSSLVFILAASFHSDIASAQEGDIGGPIYIVQQGDTLWDIAVRFGVDLEALKQANGITDPGTIVSGAQLVIPGLEGIQGILKTQQVPFGETLRSLSRRNHISQDELARLNHLTSPMELYSGASLVIPENTEASIAARVGLASGQSILEVAALRGVNPWSIIQESGLQGTWEALPGEVLRVPTENAVDGPGALPGEITGVELEPLPLIQGGTSVIRLSSDGDLTVQGSFINHPLNFFPESAVYHVALQGIHAMQKPGLYPLVIQGTLADGKPFGFRQMVPVLAGDFAFESLPVPPDTVDPANTEPEDKIWNNLPLPATPERLWQGLFGIPVITATPECYSSQYGNRRSYNGSPYNYFHTGLDFCYNYNLDVNEIRAPASGVVIYTGELIVRGMATMIDHGWGVYTGYMHQSEILVEPGDRVEAGQLIGHAGGTGRASGPHLHLEVWVGGVQVNPMDWLLETFP